MNHNFRKYRYALIVGVMGVLILGATVIAHEYHALTCHKSAVGTCLPAGTCVGPTDGVVDCDTLPSKPGTDSMTTLDQ